MNNEIKEVGKKASWNFINGFCIVTFPSGKTAEFDSKPLPSNILEYYGLKQFLSDKRAGITDEAEAIEAMRSAYKSALDNGMKITETGRIDIGVVRSNSAPKTADGVVIDVVDSMTKAEAKSALYMASLGACKFSPEMLAKLEAKAK